MIRAPATIPAIPGLQTALDAKLIAASNLADVASAVTARANLGIGPGLATFLPTDLAGLTQWLDAGRMFGLAPGASVACWRDVSGNARDYAQATTAKRPTLQANIKNGLPGVLFDGVDDYLDGVGIDSTHALGAFSDFVVFKPRVLNNATGSYNGETVFTTTGAMFGLTVKSDNTFDAYHYDGTYDLLTVAGVLGENVTSLIELHIDTGQLIVRANDSPAAQGASGNRMATPEVNRLGARYNAGGGYFDGWILERCTWNRALTWAERTKVVAYLRLKYETP